MFNNAPRINLSRWPTARLAAAPSTGIAALMADGATRWFKCRVRSRKDRRKRLAVLATAGAVLAAATGCAVGQQLPDSARMIETMLRCNSYESFVSEKFFHELQQALRRDEERGLVLYEGAKEEILGETQNAWSLQYRFAKPTRILGLPAVRVADSFGMLPAVNVVFDAPMDSVKAVYGRTGFEFKCDRPATLDGTFCEGSRDVEPPPPGQPPLEFFVLMTDSPTIAQGGKSQAACTIKPRGGNVFQ